MTIFVIFGSAGTRIGDQQVDMIARRAIWFPVNTSSGRKVTNIFSYRQIITELSFYNSHIIRNFAPEMNETKKGFIQLHLSVLLAGFTGLFGRLITLNEVDIVWYRMLFTSCLLLVFTGLPRVGWRKFLELCGCGALLGLHWMLFYGSIKASNVSIGVICFSLIGFFTAIFEPLIFKKRFSAMELFFSLITVAGVLCIFSLDARYRYGILIGVASSAVCALYAICNKKASVGVRSRTVLMYHVNQRDRFLIEF